MSKEVPANLPKPQIDPELKKKGAVGQDELQAWFDRNGFSYVAICQAESTFARLFTNEVKRPDFLLVVDGLGMIAVDAKHCEPQKLGKAYTLNYDGEVRKAIMFERVFVFQSGTPTGVRRRASGFGSARSKRSRLVNLPAKRKASTWSYSLKTSSLYSPVRTSAGSTRNACLDVRSWPLVFLLTLERSRPKRTERLRGNPLRSRCVIPPSIKGIA